MRSRRTHRADRTSSTTRSSWRSSAPHRASPSSNTATRCSPPRNPCGRTSLELATALMERTRDVRVVPHLGRALTHTQGLSGTVEAMQLIQALLERFWDAGASRASSSTTKSIPMLRMNALAALTDRDKLVRDIRSADFLRTPALAFTVRDVENILDQNVGKIRGRARAPTSCAPRSSTRSSPNPAALPEAGSPAARRRRHQGDDPEASRAVAPARFRAADLAHEADRLHRRGPSRHDDRRPARRRRRRRGGRRRRRQHRGRRPALEGGRAARTRPRLRLPATATSPPIPRHCSSGARSGS